MFTEPLPSNISWGTHRQQGDIISLLLLAYILYFENTKGSLWNHLCAYLCISLCMSICPFITPNLRLMRSPCCLCIPLIFGRRFMRSPCCLCVLAYFFVLYAVCVISKENRWLILPRTSCFLNKGSKLKRNLTILFRQCSWLNATVIFLIVPDK
jgi:hypothetical protein